MGPPFTWTVSGTTEYTHYTTTLTAPASGLNPQQLFIGWNQAGITAHWLYVDDVNLVPVPEPSTIIAGALALLPFGASALRMLRKSRKA